MKWIVALLLLPFVGAAQGVKVNQYDKFIKKYRVEMEAVPVLSSTANTLAVTFSAVAAELFVQVSGWGWGATTVDDGNELVFVFSNDSTITAAAAGLQTFEMGLERNSYKHRYHITQAGVQALSRLELTGLRKYSFKESSETKVPKEARAKLQKAATSFLSELKKMASHKTLKQIGTNNIAGYIGDSVRFCSNVYNTRYTQTADGMLTVLELQADFSQPVVNVIIPAEDRSKFGELPEKFYLNKDVCITGVVTLRNDVPTIVVRNNNQLREGGDSTGAVPTMEADAPSTTTKTIRN